MHIPDILDIKILYVEDDVPTRELTKILLMRRVREVYAAGNGKTGLELYHLHSPDLVITDIRMPVMNGLEMAREIKAADRDAKIILTTAHNDVSDLISAIEIGIDNYVMKPILIERLYDAIRKAAEIIEYKNSLARYEEERERMILELKSALEAKSMLIKKLEYISITDALTGVFNRRYFDDFIYREWKRAIRSSSPLSMILLDVDFFKNYNDRYGHMAGDICLNRVAQALRLIISRPYDLIARYGGDEFAIILPETGEHSISLAANCRTAVENLRIVHEDSKVSGFVTISAGVSIMVPGKDSDQKEMIQASDDALYRAKRKGRNSVIAENGMKAMPDGT